MKVADKHNLTQLLALNKEEHMGRWLNIEESHGPPPRQEHSHDPNREGDTIFVGNLSFNITEEQLK